MDIDGTNPYANCKLVGDDHATGAGKSTGAMWIGGGTTVGFENFDAANNDVVALSPDGYIYEECVKDGGSGTTAFESKWKPRGVTTGSENAARQPANSSRARRRSRLLPSRSRLEVIRRPGGS